MAFIENKYYKVYYNLVKRAKSRQLSEDTYIEKHHIIPKGLGGTNSKDNIVSLTAREHFICHWLLTKMTSNDAKRKMYYALSLMRTTPTKKRYTTPITSRVFEKVRKHLAPSAETKQKISKTLKGRKFTDEHRKKISMANKGRIPASKGKVMSQEQKEKIRLSNLGKNKGKIAWNKGKAHPCKDDTRLKIAIANSGKIFSDDHKQRMSLAKKGKAKPKFTCRVCGELIGGEWNYQRHQSLCNLKKKPDKINYRALRSSH